MLNLIVLANSQHLYTLFIHIGLIFKLFFTDSTLSGLELSSELSVESWLQSINLSSYKDNFETNLYTEMDRIVAIWDDELTSILDIEKIGHRKRILLCLAGRDGMKHRFGKVKASNKNRSGFFQETHIKHIKTCLKKNSY